MSNLAQGPLPAICFAKGRGRAKTRRVGGQEHRDGVPAMPLEFGRRRMVASDDQNIGLQIQ